jgi:hypothetical protein
MRYYQVTSENGVHVCGVLFEKSRANESLGGGGLTLFVYTYPEMLANPDLAAALERFYDPSNYEYQVTTGSIMLRELLDEHVGDAQGIVLELEEDAGDLPEDDPYRQRVERASKLLNELALLVEDLDEAYPEGITFTDLPDSRLYTAWKRREEERAVKAAREAETFAVGASA